MSAERAGRFVEDAYRLAGIGWALIRLDGKIPKGKDWQHTEPLRDPHQAAGLWSEWGKRWNMGTVLGAASLAVLEYDLPEAHPRFLELIGETEPPLCRTGSGKHHAYFAAVNGVAKAARDGLELRVGAHQCVIPPSVHPDTGEPYVWERAPWDVPLPPLPARVFAYFAVAGDDLRERLQADPNAKIYAGQRRDQVFRLACSLVARGVPPDAILSAARAFNKTRCEPPLANAQVVDQVNGAVGRYDPATALIGKDSRLRPTTSSRLRPPVTSSLVPTPSGGDEVDHLVPDVVPSSSQKPHSWLPVDLVARGANPPRPPEIIGLFYPGYNHLVSGESEALKTWLALIASVVELASGRGVLWVDGDDVGEGALLERLRLLGADDDAIARLFAYVAPDEPLDKNHRADVLEVVHARRCQLAVLDGFNPLMVLHGLNPDSGTDVEKFYRLIDPIRKSPAAIYLSDNVVKAREARGVWAIGSERKKSKAEVHLGMKALVPLVRGGTGRAKIEVHKDRPGHLQRPSPGVLVIESGAGRCSWEIRPDESRDAEGDFRPTALMEKVSRYLELQAEPCSRNQIESMKLGKAEYVRVAIDRLIGEDYATEFEGPRRARLVRLERRFREEEDA